MRGAERKLEKKRWKKGRSKRGKKEKNEDKKICPFDAKKICPATPNLTLTRPMRNQWAGINLFNLMIIYQQIIAKYVTW